MALGLNGALINWAIQSLSFTAPKHWLDKVKSGAQVFNPVFTGEDYNELKDKIEALKVEINKLKL